MRFDPKDCPTCGKPIETFTLEPHYLAASRDEYLDIPTHDRVERPDTLRLGCGHVMDETLWVGR